MWKRLRPNCFRANGERHWTLQFQYDQNGSPVGVSFRDCGESTFTYVYYYAKNLQGDIVGLYKRNPDGTGAQVIATYEYDPWGKVTAVRDANGNLVTYPSGSNLIAFMNPLRYRGYYQDNDTGFYYLQSRYYDPELKRFINADSYSSTGQGFLGYNMFAYCENMPVSKADADGHWGLALASGGYLAASTFGLSNIWNPIGWVVLGVAAVALATVAVVEVVPVVRNTIETFSKKAKTGERNPDPYARPGQKKQNRERKNKARKSDKWVERSKPKPPKKHTPGRDHRRFR